jgi:radical SAM superfamily enzyme YgiQ (UPF0313 family)
MKDKRVAIIIPPKINSEWIIREEGRTRIERVPYAPYQAACIVGLLKKEIPDIYIMVIDSQLDDLNHTQMARKLETCCPELVLVFVSAYHLTYDSPFIGFDYPTIVIMTPASVDISEAITTHNLPPAVYLKQEREWTTLAAVKVCLSVGNLEEVPGLVIKQPDGELVDTGFPLKRSMEQLPLPDFEALRFNEYLQKRYEASGTRATLIETMHGCLFHCSYCSHGNTDKKVTFKSARQVVDEIEILVHKYNVEHMEFLDSEFSVNLNRAKEICRLIIERGLKFTWYVNNRVDLVDEELLYLMKKSGCVEIAYGIETADPDLQKIINKDLDLEVAANNITMTKKAGITVSLFMMIGIPGENRESIEKNIEFLSRVKPDEFAVSTLFLVPGTELYRQVKEKGEMRVKSWDEFRKVDKLQFHHEFYRNVEEINATARYMRKRILRNLAFSDESKPFISRLLCFIASLGYHERLRNISPKLYYGLINYYKNN